MTSKFWLAAAPLLALLSAPAQAQRSPAVTPEQMRKHIEVLASDEYEGRKPGTSGETKTLSYIAGHLQRLGLEPAAGNGSWYQPVGLVSRKPLNTRAIWSAGGKPLNVPQDQLVLLSRDGAATVADAPVVFVGHAVVAPDKKVDQLSGVDVNGAVVLMLFGNPPGLGVPPAEERMKFLRAAGAAAIIAILPEAMPWAQIGPYFAQGREQLQSEELGEIAGAMSNAAGSALLDTAGGKSLLAAALKPDFKAVALPVRARLDVSTDVRKYMSYNVIGRLPGSGKTGESVLYLGHWDHLGVCRPPTAEDPICNGAVDNASGIAMLLEVAANIARGKRPERDLLFMGTTAEEMGLLGAEYFAANPPMPLKSIVAAINIDTVAIHRKGEPVAVIGRGNAPLDRLIAETAEELGRKVDADTEADSFIMRQDGWKLTQAGVPTVMIGGSFANMKQLGAFLESAYHKPEDDLDRELILDGAAEDTDLLILLGRKLADPKRFQPAAR